ncbi:MULTISPECIES: aspartate/glutamate racemase family protein [unclassified Paludibacterium]|uniref:aspartate/glutamate racemase family protein n=1 Tax=unclassified Paludibacterium TaxID=2618429 RepID=UPI001C046444|nr:aspartate/glutamate racemase family protein [Paludibacterium sp. B53371]BEV72117.1 aspartate/glutamate racemase family protein [Paludibacterium sp. THUN1379]
MKTIGLIGGMSWESSAHYYQLINQSVKARLGGQHNARSLLLTVDFAEIETLQVQGDWQALADKMACAARQLAAGGADGIVLCTNTMHKLAPVIEAASPLPLLHIADATGKALRQAGIDKVGLLGTRYTMEQDFYRQRLTSGHGIDVLIPQVHDREDVHRIIYEELCQGILREDSRQLYGQIMARLQQQGAQAIVLGCTEIGLLIKQADSALPVFDTTVLHAEAAVEWALAT